MFKEVPGSMDLVHGGQELGGLCVIHVTPSHAQPRGSQWLYHLAGEDMKAAVSLLHSHIAVGWGFNTQPVGQGGCESKMQKGGGHMHGRWRHKGMKVGKSQEDP